MEPALFIFVIAILGLLVGSFLNVVIYRLPLMLQQDWRRQCAELLEVSDCKPLTKEKFNLIVPRSRCPECNHLIRAIDNIPVISFILLKGKCRNCGTAINPRYPLVELLTCLLSAVVAWKYGYQPQTAALLLFTWTLICLAFIDLDHKLLPDDLTMPLLWLGLTCNLFSFFTDINSSIIGAILGYGVLWAVFQIFKLITGKEGMGYGDFKLLAVIGAWCGWQFLPQTILVSSILGSIIGLLQLVISKQGKNTAIPFGPYLAIAGWIAIIWGVQINNLYFRLF